jgi:hypothetical protein
VVYVSGNDVMIKGEDGELRDFNNVPDSLTVNVERLTRPMGRAVRVDVKRIGVEVARAIKQALLRRQTGVLRNS